MCPKRQTLNLGALGAWAPLGASHPAEGAPSGWVCIRARVAGVMLHLRGCWAAAISFRFKARAH